MADFKVLKRAAGAAHYTPTVENTGTIGDQDISQVSDWITDGSGNNVNLFTDNNVTAITIGNGAGTTTINLGNASSTTQVQGDLTVNGTTLTIDTSDLTVDDAMPLLRAGQAGAGESGIAIERGSTGDDAFFGWIEATSRFELGLFDTTNGGGTNPGETAPAGALGTVSPWQVSDLLMAGTLLEGIGSLAINQSQGADVVSLAGRGTTVAVNETGEESLDGTFTATSIIGALNELRTGSTANSFAYTYTNNGGSTINEGAPVYQESSAAESILASDATSDGAAANVLGFVTEAGGIASLGTGEVTIAGRLPARFPGGLTTGTDVVIGDEVFLNTTAGEVTVDISGFTTGNVVLSLGYVTSYLSYDGSTDFLIEIQFEPGMKSVV